ncbi:hypothetical protein [Anaerotruncus rubiinfantis]|uniref:hypothetical protein n=1 Tax=Anaerotruncus rubiinfantis TaxID=1720200 RepID=UPI0011CB4897|nr:hypothetical protein [Anaerotruncus rubiinfantis]
MRDVKTKPPMGNAKVRERSALLPRTAGRALLDQYRAQKLRPADREHEESPNAEAASRVETSAKGAASGAGRAVKYGAGAVLKQRGIPKGRGEPDAPFPAGDSEAPRRAAIQTVQKKAIRTSQEAGRPFETRGFCAGPEPTPPRTVETAKREFQIRRFKEKGLVRRDALRAADAAQESRLLSASEQYARQTGQAALRAGWTRGAGVKTAQAMRLKARHKAEQQAAKQAAQKTAQATKAAAKTTARIVKIVVEATKKLVQTLLAAIGAGGALVVLLLVAVVAGLLASPFGIFFSDEDKRPEVMPVREIVAQTNAEFVAAIQGIIDDNSDVDGMVYDFFGCATSAVPNNWSDIVAVFAVKTNLDSETGMDVVTMDAERVELMKAVFWDMNQLDHWVECIPAADEEEEDSYILHIEITGNTAAEMAGQYGFNSQQWEVLDTFLSPEYVESLWQLTETSIVYFV